jgi:SSS family solute:Na+ symporter
VAQRILGARTETDARKGTIASLLPWCVITGVSTMVGILGAMIVPELTADRAEELFPLYMQRYLPSGLLGLGVASLVVASMSTGAGIGTAIAGLMTVDVFKPLKRKTRSDRYYLWITRLFASLSIICGTMFAMFIDHFKGMIPFYVAFTGTFFLPMVVPYVGGALYRRASRGSGMAALVAGIGLGSILFLGYELPQLLECPQWSIATFLGHPTCRPFWVIVFAACIFVCWSVVENRIRGPIPKTQLASILNAVDLGREADSEAVRGMLESRPLVPWDGQANLDYESLGTTKTLRWYSRPGTFELSAFALLVLLMIWWW